MPLMKALGAGRKTVILLDVGLYQQNISRLQEIICNILSLEELHAPLEHLSKTAFLKCAGLKVIFMVR